LGRIGGGREGEEELESQIREVAVAVAAVEIEERLVARAEGRVDEARGVEVRQRNGTTSASRGELVEHGVRRDRELRKGGDVKAGLLELEGGVREALQWRNQKAVGQVGGNGAYTIQGAEVDLQKVEVLAAVEGLEREGGEHARRRNSTQSQSQKEVNSDGAGSKTGDISIHNLNLYKWR
jgi:hypothetical protein